MEREQEDKVALLAMQYDSVHVREGYADKHVEASTLSGPSFNIDEDGTQHPAPTYGDERNRLEPVMRESSKAKFGVTERSIYDVEVAWSKPEFDIETRRDLTQGDALAFIKSTITSSAYGFPTTITVTRKVPA